MPWIIPPTPPKKKYSMYGWSLATPTRAKPTTTRKRVDKSGNNPFYAGGSSANSFLNGGSNPGSSSSSSSGSSSSNYPDYNDPYAALLSQLASQRDQNISQLRANLSGREAAIAKLYADQVPLVQANYDQAEKAAAAVNDAVHNALTQEGATANTNLLSKLAALGSPDAATQNAAKSVADYYAGIGGANYAQDAGDVQRLIGRLAEEKTYLGKQPGIVNAQLESQYAQDMADLLNQYQTQYMDLSQQQASGLNDYNTAKFTFEQQQKQNAADTARQNEQMYWDNYWKRQDMLERRYEVAVASHDKKAQRAIQIQMQNAKAQSAIDVANIRAGNAIDVATIKANASTQNAQTAANAKGGKNKTNISQSRALKAALDMVINPKSGFIKAGININQPELSMQRIINNTLRGMGIDPFSSEGTAIRRSVMQSASGHKFFSNQKATFRYDPNWAGQYTKP